MFVSLATAIVADLGVLHTVTLLIAVVAAGLTLTGFTVKRLQHVVVT